MFAHGGATDFDPWFETFHTRVDERDYASDVGASLRGRHFESPRLGIAYVVEVDAVDVVLASDFFADGGDVVCRLVVFGVEVALLPYPFDEFGVFSSEGGASSVVPFANGYGHDPRMEFHPTAVALSYGEGQRVVGGRGGGEGACEGFVPWFDGGGIDGGGANARLEEDGVDARLLETVEEAREFSFLFGCGGGVWPVESAEGGEPYGAYFSFGDGVESERHGWGLRLQSGDVKDKKI